MTETPREPERRGRIATADRRRNASGTMARRGDGRRFLLRRLYVVINLLVLAGFVLYAVNSWHQAREQARIQLAYIDRLIAQFTRAALDQQGSALELLGRELVRAGALENPARARDVLERVAARNPGMTGFGFARPDGQLISLASAPPGQPLPNLLETPRTREAFRKALASPQLQLGPPYYLRALGEWLAPLWLRIQDESGRVRAVLTAGYKLGAGARTWAQITPPEHVHITILREDGYLQLRQPADIPEAELYARPRAAALLQRLTEAAGKERLSTWIEPDGATTLLAYTHLPEYGLYTLAEIPLAQVYAQWAQGMAAPGMLVVTLLLIGAAAYRWSSRSQRRYEDELVHQAQHDILTGLPNRTLVMDRLQQSLEEAAYTRRNVALLFLDLDHFKNVNDRYGHDVGDELLQEVAGRLAGCVAPGDTVARLGGDEFIIILPAIASHQVADKVASRILQCLKQPVRLGALSLPVSTSIGIAIAPQDATTAGDLMSKADLALYKVKESGRNNYGFFTDELNRQVARRLAIEEELPMAVVRGELEVYYQPQWHGPSGAIVGLEALARWNNPRLGSVPPDEFIPIAEDLGLIRDIDDFVLATACAVTQVLGERLGIDLRLAVNISARELLDSDIAERVADALAGGSLPAERLVLEITETALVSDFERAAANVARFRNLGVGVSIDDFGTGYASLTYLSRLKVTEIKIDRDFVRDMLEDVHDRTLTHSIISMGKALGLDVVAEGVETEAQRLQLQSFGCHLMQGHLISPPVPLRELEPTLRGLLKRKTS